MKTALLITTFNRPGYLKQCLESISNADLSQVNTVLIVDDCSTYPETRRLIDDFDLEDIELIKCYSKENRSIKGSLLFGYDVLFNTCDVVINLDADAIFTKDAFNRLLQLHERFPSYIKTGFNCLTKNKDGSTRHHVIETGDGYNLKKSVGGINMVFEKTTYLQIVKPALIKCLKTQGNWDHAACISSYEGYGRPIVCLTPSCVQHIGTEISSMGHSVGGEPPDVADDFTGCQVKEWTCESRFTMAVEIERLTLILDNVTLIAVDDNIDAIIKAADISCRQIKFAEVKLLSSTPSDDPRSILIRQLGSKKEYSKFLMKEIYDYISTDFFITVQGDGFILDGLKFKKEWFNYDYIGSPWHFYNDGMNVGNGAMSFRSKKLHKILKEDSEIIPTNDHLIKEFQEDHNIGRIYRKLLEHRYGIKFAPIEVAERFGIEAWGVKPPGNKYSGQFGFHGFSVDFNDADLPYIPYKLPNRQIL